MKSFRALGLLLTVLFGATLEAALTRAWWSVVPETPYAGQPYTLALTLETGGTEEIGDVNIPNLPPGTSAEVAYSIVAGKRHTTFRIRQSHATERIVALPESQIRATVQTLITSSARIHQFRSSVQTVTVPAFSYTVKSLPKEAEGALLGNVSVTFTANKRTFFPGEVLELTARVSIRDGYLPEAVHLALEGTTPGRAYPFRVATRTAMTLTATAFYIAEGEAPITLTLAPLTGFDPSSATLKSVSAKPLTLTPQPQVSEEPQTITLHLGTGTVHGLPLRFAPREGALVIGALSEPYTRHEVSGNWTRVACQNGDGWILTEALGEAK